MSAKRQFRQSHKGVERVNSDHGLIAVAIDNDGTIVNLYDSTKTVLGESDKSPSDNSSPRDPARASALDADSLFEKKVLRIIGDGEGQASVLREKVGYDFSGNLAMVVHQKDVEVNFGKDLKKRYKIRVPVSR